MPLVEGAETLNNRDVASLFLKLAGIYALIESLPMMQGIMGLAAGFRQFTESSEGIVPLVATALIPFALLVCLGISLIVLSNKLAPWVLPDRPQEHHDSHLAIRDVQAVAFSVAGVVVFISALPKLASLIARLVELRLPEFSDAAERLWQDIWPTTAALVCQILLGLGLFLQAKGLVAVWERLHAKRPMAAAKTSANQR